MGHEIFFVLLMYKQREHLCISLVCENFLQLQPIKEMRFPPWSTNAEAQNLEACFILLLLLSYQHKTFLIYEHI